MTLEFCEQWKLAYKKNIMYMKLLFKKIKSHMCLEIFQCTNNINQREHGVLFNSFSEAKKFRGRVQVNPKWYLKVNKHSEKVVF